MATRKFYVTKAARWGTSGGTDAGAGACDHLPYGDTGTYTYRSGLQVSQDYSGITNVTAARFYARNTTENHITRGPTSAERDFRMQRLTASWSEGSASHPMNTGNASIYPGPSGTSSGELGPYHPDDTDNSWNDWDCLAFIQRWAPSSVLVGGVPGAGDDNYGFRILANGSNDSGEFWSDDKGGSEPYILITYTTNSAPTITPTGPVDGSVIAGGGTYGSPTVTFTATMADSDGDAITDVTVWYDTDPAFGSPTIMSGATGISGYTYSRTASTGIVRGVPIYYFMTCDDGHGTGSSTGVTVYSFTIADAVAPVITGTAATVMEMTVEGTDSGPRAVVRWTYSDPSGTTQSRRVCKLQDSTGVTTYETIDVSDSQQWVKFSYASLVHGTTYKFSVETYNEDGISSGAVTQNRVAKWATRTEKYNVASPSSWSISTSITAATDTSCLLQHGSSVGSGTAPTNYNTDFSTVATAAYYWVKYWFFAWNGAATSGVSMNSHTITYSSTTLVPDGWTLSGSAVDTADYWYGTRSLKMTGNGTSRISYSIDIPVKSGETYILSGRIKSSGNSGALIRVTPGGGGGTALASTTALVASTATFSDVQTAPFSATTSLIRVECVISGAAATYAWVDALKLEVGTVVTPWSPSVLGRAVVVDGNGVQVDARAGGYARFRGSDSTSSDAEVDLSDRGLRFSSPLTLKEISSPSNPSANYRRLFLKSDGLLYLRDSGGTDTAVGSGTAYSIQHARVTVGSSIAAGGVRTDTITWPVAFADTNYTVVVTPLVVNYTSGSIICEVVSQAAGSIVVRTENKDSGSRTPPIHAIAIHD